MLPLRIIGYLGRLKMQNWKMTDQMSGVENTGLENAVQIAWVENADHIAWVENTGLRNDGPILEVVLCF